MGVLTVSYVYSHEKKISILDDFSYDKYEDLCAYWPRKCVLFRSPRRIKSQDRLTNIRVQGFLSVLQTFLGI